MKSLLLLVIIAAVTISETAPSASLNVTPRERNPEFQDAADDSRAALVRTRTSGRQGRMFNPLTMFSSIPSSCRLDDGRTGTCMKESECTAAGGRSLKNGECDRSACCLIERTCFGKIRHNNTYFVNPDFPQDTTEKQNCWLSVDVGRGAPKSCFLRLDFEIFEIGDPDDDGTCSSDSFDSYPTGKSRICGSNNGSHIYVDTKQTRREEVFYWALQVPISEISLGFGLHKNNTRRKWSIKVAYIDCDKAWAPYDAGCQQYFEGVSGTIRSFNYRESNPEQSVLSPDRYNVCIRQEANMCYIKWTSDFFSLGDSLVLIRAATNLTNGINFKTRSLFFGDKFGWKSDSTSSSAVYSASTPFRLGYHGIEGKFFQRREFDGGKGFSLRYTQLPCNKENPQAAQRENSSQIVANIKLAEGLKDSEG